ncbi:MAG: type II toxin-antitoxin system VapC family toxin [Deltaproteobacteria bacterium]|nr:type II toxin-antitoxin system VapC family toxin [Deltaproteobacteria bacterium]
MNYVIDSSGWIEFFFGLPKKDKFSHYILGKDPLLTPSLVLFEVYKKIKQNSSESEALLAISQMQKGTTIPFNDDLALLCADLSIKHKLPMADAIVYGTTLAHQAKLVTADNDFRGLKDVILIG